MFMPLLMAAGTAIGGSFLKRGADALVNKVTGVPTPQQRTGQEIGQDYKGFLDEAYPGTTPWEQLGANSPMGAIESGENQVKHQVKMQERELLNRSALQQLDLENKSAVADQTNRAHIITSLGTVSPKAAQQGLKILNNSNQQLDPWDTQTQQHGKHLPSQIKKTEEEAKKIGAQVPRENILGLASQGFNKLVDNAGSLLGTGAAKFDEISANMRAQIQRDAENKVYNRNKKPERFNK